MTDYTELVKALRHYSEVAITGGVGELVCDAAAAIEDMAKHITEMHERVTVLQIARGELEAEVKRLEPKRGKWIVHTEVKNIYGGICVECPVCGDHFVVLNVSDEKYCRSCGARMEVQG